MEIAATGAGMLGIVMVAIYALFVGTMGLVGLAIYVLTAISLSKMASRRGIKCPWLAWIPGWYMIPLAQLTDHYFKVTKNKNTKFTLFMAICYIGAYVLAILECGVAVLTGLVPANTALILACVVFLLAGIALLAIYVGVVLTYLTLFFVFRSAQPKLAILYILLSIFVPASWAVCLLIAHKHDQGLVQPEIVE